MSGKRNLVRFLSYALAYNKAIETTKTPQKAARRAKKMIISRKSNKAQNIYLFTL